MTIDQDTPVAASQPATDTSSQEVSKPKRTPTARKAKTATKTAEGKKAANAADAAPGQETSDTTATKAPASTPKASASKTTAAKASSRSAGKTTKPATAKSKKTAAASKEISASAPEAVATPDAAETAASAPSASATAKSTAKTASSRSTSRGTATRKPKTAEAPKDNTAQTASADSPTTAEATQQTSTPKTPKAPRGRSGAARGRAAAAKSSTAGETASKAASATAASAVESAAAPLAGAARNVAPTAGQDFSQPTPKPAVLAEDAPSVAAASVADPSVAAPAAVAPAAPVEISDTAAARAPRHNAAPAASHAETQQDRVAEAQEAAPSAEGSESSAAGDASAGDSPRRKNRRGRRGGRGRNRKKEQGAQAALEADNQASSTDLADELADDLTDELANGVPNDFSADLPNNMAGKRAVAQVDGLADAQADTLTDDLDDDADNLDLDDELSESAQESRPRQAHRQGKTQQGKQASRQADSGRGQDNKTSDSAKTSAKGEKTAAEAPKGKRRMFISVLPGEQVEVALAEDGQLLEYYLDMLHQRKIKGNIYKGVIHNIDTNLQAAFVSYGAGKNGFLQIDEVHPEYWLAHHEPSKGKKFPPIQKVLKAGQEVLVQVVKEPTGSKGAFLTTWLSLAGRFLVLTPGQDQIGVSRKVDDDEERARLREMMNGIDPGQGLGVIVRTVSAGTTKTTLKNDLQYLKRVWRDIRKKATEVSAPSLIYQEPGLSERAVRDYLTEDVCEIWVDNDSVAQSVRETVNLLFPRRRDLVRMHTDMRTPMWERFNLRRQLEQIYSREVLLPSGGRLVFDQTEALMAIDINSGKISGKGNFEAMAHKTNMEAADAIARHLKLRDIGGLVVIDFIEMRDKKHVLEVEKTLRTAMKNDRARHDVSRMSSFGLLELVRQRTGSSALAISLEPCPACGGTGMRRNIEWQALQALRELRRMMSTEPKEKCVYSASPELALYLLNHKRDTLREIEQDYGKCLEIMVRP